MDVVGVGVGVRCRRRRPSFVVVGFRLGFFRFDVVPEALMACLSKEGGRRRWRQRAPELVKGQGGWYVCPGRAVMYVKVLVLGLCAAGAPRN
jgi:hypothetical protein